MMDQESAYAPTHVTATVAADWEKNWEQGRYPYPRRWYSLTPPIHIQGFGNLPFSSAIKANHYPAASQWQQLVNFSAHEYQVRSFALWEDSPIATLFYSFQDHAYQSIANGTSASSILGSGITDVELIFRSRTPDDPYDVCSWACEMWKNVVNFDIYVVLASCVVASGLMRVCLSHDVFHHFTAPRTAAPQVSNVDIELIVGSLPNRRELYPLSRHEPSNGPPTLHTTFHAHRPSPAPYHPRQPHPRLQRLVDSRDCGSGIDKHRLALLPQRGHRSSPCDGPSAADTCICGPCYEPRQLEFKTKYRRCMPRYRE